MAIKACLFDMGNVLVYFSHDQMCANVVKASGASLAVVKKILIEDGLQWQIECGKITEAEFHHHFQVQSETTVDKAEFLNATADIFELNQTIVPLIDELKQSSMKLVLLSNTSANHLEFIRDRFSILDAFDDMTTSFQVGELKPNESIYLDAIQRAGCLPEECFYTDDIEAYVLKGRDLGLNAEIYTSTDLTRTALRKLGVDVAAG
ncbi:MAG: HAD family phosphatase [Fuerstiella sp.]